MEYDIVRRAMCSHRRRPTDPERVGLLTYCSWRPYGRSGLMPEGANAGLARLYRQEGAYGKTDTDMRSGYSPCS